MGCDECLTKGVQIMELFSEKGFVVASTTMFVAVALIGITTITTPAQAKSISYVANGTTDIKTAKMLQRLLKNSKELEVQVHAKRSQPQYNVGVSYTVTGTTSVKNARKLIQLFNTSKHIQVNVDVTHYANQAVVNHKRTNQYAPQSLPLYAANYPAVYMQVENNPYNWYPVALYQPLHQSMPMPVSKIAKEETTLRMAQQ